MDILKKMIQEETDKFLKTEQAKSMVKKMCKR